MANMKCTYRIQRILVPNAPVFFSLLRVLPPSNVPYILHI